MLLYTRVLRPGSKRSSLEDKLCEKFGSRQHFHYIVACEDVACHKPDPTPVLVLARMAGVSPADVEVIGDTTFDIEMGNGCGCRTIAVTYGNHDAQTLATAHPTYMVDEFVKIMELV